jgi:hypothetical protein
MSGKMSLVPVIHLTPQMRRNFYFSNSTSGSVSISFLELIGTLGGICTVANTTIQNWASSLKVNHLRVWPSMSASGVESVVVDWVAGPSGFVPDRADTVINVMGSTIPHSLTFTPPRNSLAGDWLNTAAVSSSANIFNLTFPSGCVWELDVTITLGMVNSTTTTTFAASVATGTLGNIYYLALDGTSSNKIAPVGGTPTTH